MSKIKVGKKSYEEKEVKKNILKLNILSFILICLIIYSSAFAFNLAIIGILALLLIISILSANEFKSALRVKASDQKKVEQDVEQKYETFNVAGTSFRQKEIKMLISGTDDFYDCNSVKKFNESFAFDKVYKYTFNIKEVSVQPEQGGKYDGAMRVELDGVHVGYIKKDDIERFEVMANLHLAYGVIAVIKGGPFKELKSDPFSGEEYILSREDDFYIILKYKIK